VAIPYAIEVTAVTAAACTLLQRCCTATAVQYQQVEQLAHDASVSMTVSCCLLMVVTLGNEL
jgi:hypothetical protein